MEVAISTSGHEECVVTGALYVTLWLSRLFGIAPLRFVPLQNGYRVSISHFHALYGYILVTLLNIIGCLTLLADTMYRIFDLSWSYVFFCISTIIMVFLSLRGSYCAVRRMKNLMRHLTRLEKIKTNMAVAKRPKKIQYRAMYSALVIIYLCITINICISEIVSNIKKKDYVPLDFTYLVFYVHLFIMFLFQALIVFIFLEVQSYLDMIKNTINDMVALDALEDLSSPSASKNIRCLSRAYVTACDVVSKVHNEDSSIVFLLVCYLMAKVLYIGCLISAWTSPPSLYTLVLVISWCIINVINFQAFIEAFNRVTNEVTNIKLSLSKLMNKATAIGHRVPMELDLMFKLLYLNKMTFSPLSLFTLERLLPIRILSGIFSYFLFVIQTK